ncbi:hypothetical protein BDZ45DRAFT_809242 [Acephala macrosclerotiorum]|nr:hypothetical protein BDZ45DRAFT_809242 [Acephala macrosclerotiorum]
MPYFSPEALPSAAPAAPALPSSLAAVSILAFKHMPINGTTTAFPYNALRMALRLKKFRQPPHLLQQQLGPLLSEESVHPLLIVQAEQTAMHCTSDSQCAYNTCNDGLCNGFIPSATTSTPAKATGTVALGEQCSFSADCYAVSSMLIPSCDNFQASCTLDDQCAYNTCNDGLCNGFIASTTTTSVARTESTSTTVYLPLGADCNPDSTPCANGADCYASNSMLQPRCGNFASSCTSGSVCIQFV